MIIMSEFEKLESGDKNTRVEAAKALGNTRTKTSLRALLNIAENDQEKDVRKAAIDSLEKLNDPEAIPTLEKVAQDDKDRGTRNRAKDVANKIQSSGAPLPDTEFSEEDAKRAREDFRALEAHEVKQTGLHVKMQEILTYRIDQDNNLIGDNDEPIETLQGKGEIGQSVACLPRKTSGRGGKTQFHQTTRETKPTDATGRNH